MGLKPCKQLEKTLQKIHWVFGQTRVHYWVHFGALIGIAKKDGVIPDGDIDVCCYYENSDMWRHIRRKFEGQEYVMSKAMLNDVDRDRVMYMGFNPKEKQTREHLIYASASGISIREYGIIAMISTMR